MENKFEYKVFNTINSYNLIQSGDRIVVAVSGGSDSIALLNVLINLRKEKKLKSMNAIKEDKGCQNNPSLMANFEIFVAHVNHMIRAEAKEDELFVKDFCEKNEIRFFLKSIDVQKMANTNKIGTEEAGRIARYDFFDEVLKLTNSNKIAIAHNKNDKAETILMNVLRGSGVSGLKGIEAVRGKYIRPLIDCERIQIEEYCEEQNLKPRIDKTNFENVYRRNKIRNQLIPYIKKEFNPNIIETIDRLSSLVVEEEDYIEKQVKKAYTDLVLNESENEIILNLKRFNNEEKVIKSRLLLYTITKLFGSTKGIERIHIEDLLKLCSNNVGNKFLTPNKNLKVLIKEHKIYCLKVVNT